LVIYSSDITIHLEEEMPVNSEETPLCSPK